MVSYGLLPRRILRGYGLTTDNVPNLKEYQAQVAIDEEFIRSDPDYLGYQLMEYTEFSYKCEQIRQMALDFTNVKLEELELNEEVGSIIWNYWYHQFFRKAIHSFYYSSSVMVAVQKVRNQLRDDET
jgi:hypothetical protein